MNILEIAQDLYLAELPLDVEGFRKFISSWIIKDGQTGVVVDVGPAATISRLVESIRYLGIKKIEFVLLTHVHLDHAGGLGDFIGYYPDAKVVVHENGEKHLTDPEKLWRASKEVLGNFAQFYGIPKPTPEDRIFKGSKLEFAGEEIKILNTPGHASHHQCFVFKDFIFVGEALGVYLTLKSDYYLRPSTPPKFFFEAAQESIRKIESMGNFKVCFAHFGFRKDGKEIITAAKKQLSLWVEEVYDVAFKRDFKDKDTIIEIAKQELLEKDNRFNRYYLLDIDIQKREDYFIKKSLEGILEYIYRTYCP
ncbi:MAG: MBL fold metallo-hydrolase [Archaeoglobaceae archaeon]